MRRLLVLVPLIVLGVTAGIGAAQAAPPSDGDRWALIIGIDHFQGATRPNTGAVGDAEDTRAALLAAGWPADHIRTLTDANATAAGIRDGLAWLASKSSDTSFSVMAYSGHVKQVGSTEYIWPHDNQFIADTDFASSLRAVKGYLWAHFSGCEAAGFDEGLSGPKRLVTAASQSNEKGYELSPELRNSVFTNLMIDKGLLRKQADLNKDGKVDNAGDGFGLLVGGSQPGYIQDAKDHAELSATAPDATENIKQHAAGVIATADNVQARVTTIRDQALAMLRTPTIAEARPLVATAVKLAGEALNGVPTADGKVLPVANSGGALTRYDEALLMATMPIQVVK